MYNTEEIEDLTLFANESFDTHDVDLFEFSSEESSPLTRLKSIILSLDWEINDEILQELADELSNLQTMWQGDKVAEVYLQGLDKTGNYIRNKGHFAHPNSIKLLMTFFYNFEKIISSHNITGEEITKILKGDIRKFKILQYQINQSEVESTPVTPKSAASAPVAGLPATPPMPPSEADPVKQLKAAILSLDWEVTDESLKHFQVQLTHFHDTVADNRFALVLVQGLQALGEYIGEERAEAHPEAFNLLHSFNEALELLASLKDPSKDQNKVQEILVEQINRLNNLKLLITSPAESKFDDQMIDEVVDEISGPVAGQTITEAPFAANDLAESPAEMAPLSENSGDTLQSGESHDASMTDNLEAEIDTLFSFGGKPAMESADIQYPDEILSSDAIQPVEDELADDLIEASLQTGRGLMPALSDAEEMSGYTEDAEPLDLPGQSDLVAQLDFLFSEAENSTVATDTPEPAAAFDDFDFDALNESGPVAALADVEPDTADTGDDTDEDSTVAALSDIDQPDYVATLGLDETESDPTALDIQSKLDTFFADASEEQETAQSKAGGPSVEEIEQSLFFTEDSPVESALAGSDEGQGFSETEALASLGSAPTNEIEEKLDFFFGIEADQETAQQKEDAPVAQFATEADHTEVAPALSGSGESRPADASVDKDLEGQLDFFFDATDDDEEGQSTETIEELTMALEASIDGDPGITSKPSEHLNQIDAIQDPEGRRQIAIASLGVLLPGMVKDITRARVADVTLAITTLQKEQLSPAQQALVQLLNAAVGLLGRTSKRNDADTERLFNYLYENIVKPQGQQDILPQAVNRYAEWMQRVCATMPLIPAVGESEGKEPHFEYTARELYFELSELRSNVREEFAKLRHEMHHKN